MKILQIVTLSMISLMPMAEAINSEVAMSKCTRKEPMESSSTSEENTGPYDEEYGDGTDVEGDPYGDGDGAPEAEDQDQS